MGWYFKAHFWLKDESKSYLSNYKYGGGALQNIRTDYLLFLILKINKLICPILN